MKTFRSLMLPAMALGAALLLSACGGPPADGGSYKTATELKDALVKAGISCDDWDPHNKSTLADTSGSCGDHYAISVYDDMENLAMWVETNKALKTNGVAGKNWTISGTDSKSVHDKLGGELLGRK